MARALRIQRAGGRYHVTARGNERKEIFRDDTDHFHFLELLSQSGDHFGVRVQAYVLMDNHYHLLLQAPEANLSRAMHWLNAGYCEWFNRRHGRNGHLLQGRFGYGASPWLDCAVATTRRSSVLRFANIPKASKRNP